MSLSNYISIRSIRYVYCKAIKTEYILKFYIYLSKWYKIWFLKMFRIGLWPPHLWLVLPHLTFFYVLRNKLTEKIDYEFRTEEHRSLSSSLYRFLHSPVTSSLLGPIFSSAPYSQTSSASMWAATFLANTKQKAKLELCIS